VLLHYSTDDLQSALWKLYYAALLCRTVKFFEKGHMHKLSLTFFFFHRRIQSFPPFHWFGDETLAILDDSPLKKQDTKVRTTQFFRMYSPLHIQIPAGILEILFRSS